MTWAQLAEFAVLGLLGLAMALQWRLVFKLSDIIAQFKEWLAQRGGER